MTFQKDIMEIKFSGENIVPENLRAGELADIISSFEETLMNLVYYNHPDIPKEEIVIGLVDIEDGSVKLRFKSVLPVVFTAFTSLGIAISNNNIQELPVASYRSLKHISDYTKKKKCYVEFRTDISSREPLAKITPTTEFNLPKDYYIQGETILFGKLERVGGVEPKAVLRIKRDRLISCEISQDLAIELGSRLYSWVGVAGIAKWNTKDFDIESFSINKITAFSETKLTDAINDLSNLIGKYWKDEKNVIHAIGLIRGGK